MPPGGKTGGNQCVLEVDPRQVDMLYNLSLGNPK